jgi:hypothetical protein
MNHLRKRLATSALSSRAKTVILGETMPSPSDSFSEHGWQDLNSVNSWQAERFSQHWSQVKNNQLHESVDIVEQLKTGPQALAHFSAWQTYYFLPTCLATLRVVLQHQLQLGVPGGSTGLLAPLLACTTRTLPSFISHMNVLEMEQLLCTLALYQYPISAAPGAALASFFQRQHAHTQQSDAGACPHVVAPQAVYDAHFHPAVFKLISPALGPFAASYSQLPPACAESLCILAAAAAVGLLSPALVQRHAVVVTNGIPAGKSLHVWQACIVARAAVGAACTEFPLLKAHLGTSVTQAEAALHLPLVTLCSFCSDLHALGVSCTPLLEVAVQRLGVAGTAAQLPLTSLLSLAPVLLAHKVHLPAQAAAVLATKQTASSRSMRMERAAQSALASSLRYLGVQHKRNLPLGTATGHSDATDRGVIPLALPQHRVTLHPHAPLTFTAQCSHEVQGAQVDAEQRLMALSLEEAGWLTISVDAAWALSCGELARTEWLQSLLIGRQVAAPPNSYVEAR